MNRLSPWIVRRPSLGAMPPSRSRAGALAMPAPGLLDGAAEPGGWLDDLRLFATGWIGGLIFFGTLIG